MKFFNRAFLLTFLIGSTTIFCFVCIGGWQVPVQANGVAVSIDHTTALLLPGRPLQGGRIISKLRPLDGRAKAYYNRGTAFYNKGNYVAAVKYLSRAITLEPKAPDAYFNRGLSFRRQHKIDEAVSDFSKAIKLCPRQPGYYFERCNALIVQSDLSGAITDCSEAIRFSPDEAGGYFLRGVAHMLRGDIDEALTDSVQALQIEPDHSDARRLLYVTLVKREAMRGSSDMQILAMAPIDEEILPRGLSRAEKT